jgi:hypothetical protein
VSHSSITHAPDASRPGALFPSTLATPRGALFVATYASNSTTFSTVVGDTGLYYPRFVRINPS